MFILQLSDFTNITETNDPTSPSYQPLFFLLDSTELEPAPSQPAEILVSLPSGYEATDVTVTAAGSSSNYWMFTLTDPNLGTPVWSSQVLIDISDGVRTSVWVRANTIYEEVPKDDRNASINVYGEIREV